MNNDISKKNKSDWKKFIESNEKIEDKDFKELTSKLPYKEKVIDLHGYSLEEANKAVKDLIIFSHKNKISKINIITGKGSRSKNMDDPYQSIDLGILKFSVPDYIKNNKELMNKIKLIDFSEVNDNSKGSFSIFLKI